MAWYSTVVNYVTLFDADMMNNMITYIRGHKGEHTTGGIDALTAANIGAVDLTQERTVSKWIGPGDMWLPSTTPGGARAMAETTTNKVAYSGFVAADSAAYKDFHFSWVMPDNYKANSTIVSRFYFQSAGTNTGTLIWVLAANSYADFESLDVAFANPQTATYTPAGNPTLRLCTQELPGVAITGGAAPGEYVQFRARLDPAGSSTNTVTLLGIQLFYTANSYTE